jgi:hypothetical protein
MDILKLKKTILQYVANQDDVTILHPWQLTADKLDITKDQLEYLVNEIGSDYFLGNKDGFFATNKAVVEGKYEINEEGKEKDSTLISVTNISGDGNTVIQRSSLENTRINSRSDITNNNTPHKPPKKSWLEILAWIIGVIAGGIAIYEFVIKK